MHRLSLGYTKYFNRKYNRTGSLFGGVFQSIHVDNNSRLLWVSSYVNGNAEVHKISEAKNYKWCSYPDYLDKREGNLCSKTVILGQFNNSVKDYQKFVEMVIGESGRRKDMEGYLLEKF